MPFLYQAQCCLDIIRQYGAAPVVISQINGRDYTVVNVNTFEDVDSALLKYIAGDCSSVNGKASHFSGRHRRYDGFTWAETTNPAACNHTLSRR
ncbi:iron-containing alcohol dehydrogenase family protein [Photorhabdus bodei]|uniref:Uncharacterized protein n=1 Tax=Photorhabdus bodei TaxID=2029681 RepID=A0ABX0AUC9_9GAMM|nr:iron-containing alcohol dehydrogenase family protein [Photorhabdus bodei]NDL00065.1 hypothetical protein [Photorhabdus bodei]NDL04200.1 hypothetical protein [Photorhabdus bodei]NDL08364.1 hypothetical protein [Photorhabdus bodei]